MSARDVSKLAVALCLLGPLGCNTQPALRALSPQAQGVQLENGDPPAGATLIGQAVGSDGQGCGIGGERGSLENARRALREAAARRGANFVKLTKTTTPYSGHDCYHQEFELEGLAYAAGVVTTQPLCSPPCAAGYACRAALCEPACDPACTSEQVCRADRVCVSRAAP